MDWDVRDWFREFASPPEGEELQAWRNWFAIHDVDPDDAAFDGVEACPAPWVERRDQPGQRQILYLTHGERNGQPIMVQRVVELAQSPAPFPVS